MPKERAQFVDNQGRTDCASTKLDLLATLAVANSNGIAPSATRPWIQRSKAISG